MTTERIRMALAVVAQRGPNSTPCGGSTQDLSARPARGEVNNASGSTRNHSDRHQRHGDGHMRSPRAHAADLDNVVVVACTGSASTNEAAVVDKVFWAPTHNKAA